MQCFDIFLTVYLVLSSLHHTTEIPHFT